MRKVKESIPMYTRTRLKGHPKTPLPAFYIDLSRFASSHTVLTEDWADFPFLDREVVLVKV